MHSHSSIPILLLVAVLSLGAASLALDVFGSAATGSVLLILVSLVVMGVGWKLARDPQVPWICDPLALVLLFLSQFYVVGPLVLGLGGLNRLLFFYRFEEVRILQAQLAFLIVVVTMFVGYRLQLGKILAGWLPRFPASRWKLPGIWAEMAILIGSLVGIFSWISFQGGLIAKMSSGYGQWRTGGAMFRIAFVGLQVGTMLTAWRVFSMTRSRLRDRAFLGGLIVFQVLFFGIVVGVRKYLLFLFFGLLVIYVFRNGVRRLPKAKMAALLVALLLFFSFWGVIRSRPLMDMLEGREQANRLEQEAYAGYLSGVGGPFSIACLVFEVFPQQEAFKNGQTLLVTVLGFVPRAVWPDKPVGIGKEMTRYVVGPYHDPVYGYSVTVTLPADFYLNFGWVGLLMGGFGLGVVCRTVAVYAIRGRHDGRQREAARVLLPAAFIMGLGEVRADMAMMLGTYALTFIPLILVLAVFRFDRSRAAASEPLLSSTPKVREV